MPRTCRYPFYPRSKAETDPRHLLSIIEQLHAAPHDAVMIGDSENDYAAFRAANVPVILMRYGYLRVPPETLSPDAWLDRFADIPETVANWLQRRNTS